MIRYDQLGEAMLAAHGMTGGDAGDYTDVLRRFEALGVDGAAVQRLAEEYAGAISLVASDDHAQGCGIGFVTGLLVGLELVDRSGS